MCDYKPYFRTCAICGKRFPVWSDGYVYKRRSGHGKAQRRLYFCGWNHMRQWEKENEAEKKRRRGKNKQADYG